MLYAANPITDASHVQHRARRYAHLHPQKSPRWHSHKIGAPCKVLAGRQVLETQSNAEKEIRSAPDPAEYEDPHNSNIHALIEITEGEKKT